MKMNFFTNVKLSVFAYPYISRTKRESEKQAVANCWPKRAQL